MPVNRRNVNSLSKDGSTPLKGDVTISEGTGITLTQSGQDIEIASTGGGGTVDTVVAGNNIDVDSTDPANPIVAVETLTLVDISDVTASVTEVNYTDGVTSSIQTQIDGKQPLDSDLTTIAGLTPTTDNFMVATSSAWASRTPSQAKTSLALVKGDVGLGNVDNTSDANKPVSTATQTELDTKAERIDMRNIERFTKGSGGFNVTITNAIQGVAHDGTYYYVTTKSHLYKYDSGGSLVTSHANSGDGNTHKYLGDLVVVGGTLFVSSANFDTGPPFTSYVVEFLASDLSYVTEHQVSTDDRCDSVTYHDSYFWMPMYDKTIRQYDTSWNFIDEYDMPIGAWEVDPSANGIGFDGATWVDNYLVLNPHEGIYPDCGYVLYFNGTTFNRVAQIDRPYFCTQGIDYVPSTGQVVAAERAATPRVTLMNIRTNIPDRSEWKELRRTTLTTAGDTISTIDLPSRRYLKVVCSVTTTGGTANVAFRFNNDSGTKYSRMRSVNQADGTSAVSATSLGIGGTSADTQLIIGEILNIVGTSKIGYFTASQTVDNSGATAPTNITVTGKYADTSSSISRVDVINTAGTGDYAIGSELIVYGRD
jgi:hypothetical protein